jgi:hypothetical protein
MASQVQSVQRLWGATTPAPFLLPQNNIRPR